MLHKVIKSWGTWLIAVVALGCLAGPGQARNRIGGFRPFYYFPSPGYTPGYSPFRFPNYGYPNYGYPYYGYAPNYYGPHAPYNSGVVTYRAFTPLYAAYPNANLYAWYFVTPPTDTSSAAFQPSDPSLYAPTSTSMDDAERMRKDAARLAVSVPANAEVRLNGTRMQATGRVRTFRSPALEPDETYAYEVVARWRERGRTVTQKQRVEVVAGDYVRVDFPKASSQVHEGSR